MSTTPTPSARALVFWVIWFAILSGLLMMQFMLGGGIPTGNNAPGASLPPIAFIALGEVLASTAVRWLVLPRFTAFPRKLAWMLVGIALSEGAGFFEIFLVPRNQPETRQFVLALAVFGIVQFAPIYATSSDDGR